MPGGVREMRANAKQKTKSPARKVPRASATLRKNATPKLILGKRTAALKAHLDAMPGACANPLAGPRGTAPLVHLYKVMGKMFAILAVRGTENVILKCDPHLAEMLRAQYEGVGHRSHLDRRFWISVSLDADVPPATVKRLAAQSYDLVCAGLTKKQLAELAKLVEPTSPLFVER
jgi:predicted DNA-binding protein (MmcQ/YjbR family)